MFKYKTIVAAFVAALTIPFVVTAASAADTLDVTLKSQNTNTITLGWTPQPGFGYLYFTKASESANWVLVSRTNDATKNSVRFAKGSYSYKVSVITEGNNGTYPQPTPPPPLVACNNNVDDDADGKVDFPADPGCTSATDTSEVDPAPPADTTAPSVPGGLNATAVTQTSYTFNWNASTDNVAVTGYDVQRNGVTVGSTTSALTFSNTGLTCDTAYVAGVRAKDAAGNNSAFATLSVTTSACTPPPNPTNAANLWVDSNGGTCVRSATVAAYNDASACASFAAAYTAAVSGDTVGVIGNLGVQKFAGGYLSSQGAGNKTLLFKGVIQDTVKPAGQQVFLNSVRQLNFGSPNLTFDGIKVDGANTKTQGALFENDGSPFTFKNGEIGRVQDEKASLVTGAGIVWDNVWFHDAKIVTSGVHLECMWAGVPEGMKVLNSRFTNCDVMDIFFVYPDYWTPLPAPYGNVTLENNYFGAPSPGYSVYIAKNGVSLSNQTPMSGWRVRNNYFDPASYGVNNDQPVGPDNIFCGNTGHAGMPASWKVPC